MKTNTPIHFRVYGGLKLVKDKPTVSNFKSFKSNLVHSCFAETSSRAIFDKNHKMFFGLIRVKLSSGKKMLSCNPKKPILVLNP